MKVEVKPVYEQRIVKPKDMLYSQIGYIKNYQGYNGIVVMRAYMSLFAINNAGLHWDWIGKNEPPNFDIELLPPGTSIIITVEN